VVDLVSLSVAVVAIIVAVLSWWEARRHSELLQSMAKSLAYIAKTRRSNSKAPATSPSALLLKQQSEERRRLRLEMEREKEQWRRQENITKAIGWIVDRLGEDDVE
jgi:hypothetical protein